MRRTRADPSLRRFASALAEGLHLPQTAGRIVGLLATQGRLSVRQIVARARASERGVRQNLSLLMRKGILERKVLVTANRKLAYTYSLKSVDELLAAAEREFSSMVTRLQLFAEKALPGA